MKYLQKYEEFEEQTVPATSGEDKNIKKQDIVIGRDFFRELKVKIKYWFKWGRMSKGQEDDKGRKVRFELQDIEQTESDLTLWFTYFLNETAIYAWKVCYKLDIPDAELDALKTIAVYYYCYDDNDMNILKEMDQKIDIKEDLKEKLFLKTIKDIVKTIFEKPKSDKEAREVGDSEDLTDNIY
jgi:hypothetical protein